MAKESNQLNLTVVALVALVALVGLVALTLQAKGAATGAQPALAVVDNEGNLVGEGYANTHFRVMQADGTVCNAVWKNGGLVC